MTVFQNTIENAAASAEESLNVPAAEFIEVIKRGAVQAYKLSSAENNSRAVKAEFDEAGHLQLFQEDNGELVTVEKEVEIAIHQSVELLLDLLKEKTNEVALNKERLEKEKANQLEEQKRQLKQRAEALIGTVQLAKITGKDEKEQTIGLELEDLILGELKLKDALEYDWESTGMIPVMVTSLLRSDNVSVMSCDRRSKEILIALVQLLNLTGGIKATARDPGVRSLVAIETGSIDELKNNLQAETKKISDALSGETIEFVEWDADVSRLVANCLSSGIHLEDIAVLNGEVIVTVELKSAEQAQSEAPLISRLVGLPTKIETGKETENLPGPVT